jgi:hypothetical protein
MLPRLPHSPEAERAFLGGIFLSSVADHQLDLTPGDFYLPYHQAIYRHLLRLRQEGKPTNDPVLLYESLKGTKQLDEVGGISYLSGLMDGLAKVSNFTYYAELIKTKAAIRQGIALCELMGEKLAAANGDGAKVLEEISGLAAQLLTPTVKVGQKRIMPFKTGADLAATTQKNVDWIVNGLVAMGAITELAAKVKAGKTTLILAMVRAVLDGLDFLDLSTTKTRVVYLTEQPEVSFRQAMERADLLGREDFVALAHSDTRGRNWPEVAAAAVMECKRIGAGLVVVDTLGQFAGLTGDKENNSGDALDAMGPLQLAAAEGVGIVVVRHERKSGGDVGDSGRGSSAFAGAVDIVLSLRRAEGNAPKTRRRLQSLSRFSETPADLLIDMAVGGYVALGKPDETAVKDAKNSIIGIAPQTEVEAMNLKDLTTKAGVSRQTAQRAVDELVQEGTLARIGKGKRGNAFRYFVPENHFCPTSNTEVAEKETDQNGWRGDTPAEQDPD